MANFCAAPNCTIKSNRSASLFFRFPMDTERYQWVENCHGKDLEDKTPDQLNRHYRLCAKQFEPSVICKAVSDTDAICLAFVLA
uniref:THAP-type domain-containing protein n=1 Tax=Oncorhynchus kisutch TaxID=8019 RepID=A0A8C7DPW3_ONCKI